MWGGGGGVLKQHYTLRRKKEICTDPAHLGDGASSRELFYTFVCDLEIAWFHLLQEATFLTQDTRH